MDAPAEPSFEPRKQRVSWAWCRVGALVLLVLVGLTGPVWAFFLASCTSMRPCRIGQLLTYVEASCEEGSGARSQELLHGETCTLVCDNLARVPTVAALQCVDGVANSSVAVECVVPKAPPSELPTEATLASNAITEGDARLVCEQAQDFVCEAPTGATSILIQLDSLTQDRIIITITQNPRRYPQRIISIVSSIAAILIHNIVISVVVIVVVVMVVMMAASKTVPVGQYFARLSSEQSVV
eukprot:s3972_g1.t1